MNRTGQRIAVLAATGALVLAGAPSAQAAPADVQQTPMRWHMQTGNPHLSPVGGGAVAKLARTDNGISWSVQTNSLQPGHAYTVWLVVVNKPSECAGSPCSPVDLLQTPATESQVVYGGGHVGGESGTTGFGGSRSVGSIPEGWLAGGALTDPRGAEVHLVLNSHGPALSEYLPEMIQTYRAGCTDASLPGIFPDSAKADGTPGPNTCRLTQVAIFE